MGEELAGPDTLVFAPVDSHTVGDPTFDVTATSTSGSTGTITYSVISGPAVLKANHVSLTGAGTITLKAAQAASAKFLAASVQTSFSVVRGPDSFDFAFVPSHTFGDPPFAVTAASDSTGAITYALVSGPATLSGNIVTLTGAGRVMLSATQTADSNYFAGTATAAFNVAKEPVTLTFNALSAHTFGDPPFTISAATSAPASTSPIVYQVVSGSATLSGQTVTLTGAGAVVLSASQDADANYGNATTQTTLAVAKAANTLSLSPIPDQQIGNPPVDLSATSSTSSTGAITYSIVSGPGTIAGNVVTITGSGQLVVQATQATDANYRAATTQMSFRVRNGKDLLTFDAIPSHTFGDPPFWVFASSSSTTAITYTVVSGPATLSGNLVTLTGAGSVVLEADQPADQTYAAETAQSTFVVAKATATLTFAPISSTIIYGDPPFTVSASSQATGAITYTILSGPATISGNTVTPTGPGAIVINAHQVADTNYAGVSAQTTVNLAVPNTSSVGLIQHVVVIFQENVSFDHYFGTYPNAANPTGEPIFTPLPNTPTVDGLTTRLLNRNPNAANLRNGAGAINPFRLDRTNAATADQDHAYGDEQMAFDGGAMDLFPFSLGAADGPTLATSGPATTNGLTLGYFDGNTVTGLWNYAQYFALSDHFFATNFGPSTPGAINLVSGQTNGVVPDANASGFIVPDGSGGNTLISDAEPLNDICSNTATALVHMAGQNIGNLLNTANVSWGFFTDGFDTTLTNANGTSGCRRSHASAITARTSADYIPHHEPFQYYASTANPTHARPISTTAIGKAGDGAQHQYDIHDFFDAIAAGNFPAVSYIKAPAYADGHAGYSDPLDEQNFVVSTINKIQQTSQWQNTVVIIAYDDSDGWYDHEFQIVNGSTSASDSYTSAGHCADGTTALPGVASTTLHAQGRCGYGPRLPFLVISPWARPNYVDSSVLDQTSIMRFVEDTFLNGQRLGQGSFDSIAAPINPLLDFHRPTPQNSRTVLLDPTTGLVTSVN